MPINAKEFGALPLPGQPSDLPRRLLTILQGSPGEAFTADELAANLLGRDADLSMLLDSRATAVVAAVKTILSRLVQERKVEVRSKSTMLGPEDYYRVLT